MDNPSHSAVNLENPLVYLEWEDYTTLPVRMQHAHAVVIGNKVYVGGGMTTDDISDTNIYVFDHTIKRPIVTSIPTPGPTRWSTLASFHSQLVLAGGTIDSMNATDELWALQDDGCTWVQPFPPMPQACWGASAVTSVDHLLIAGGVGSDHPLTPLDTVQIYNASSKLWLLSKPLPQCCYLMKSVLHNGNWYLAGGRWQYSKIFHASLESLIGISDIREKEIWQSLPDLSQRRCCSISVCCDQLIAVGGVTYSGTTREIQVYSTKKRSWIDVDLLPRSCDSTCTIILPMNEMLLIGGNTLSDYEQHNFSNCVIRASTNVTSSLDDKFSQNALKKIEITAGISAYSSFLCAQMEANTSEKHDNSKWLLRDLRSTHGRPVKWRDVLRHLRAKGLYDVANDIEQVFTNNTAPLQLHCPGLNEDCLGLAPPGPPLATPLFLPTNEQVLDTKLEREYELKEELGRGGFGVVYHVKSKFDRGHYALKITKLPTQKAGQDKVMREIHALVMLDHPRIIRYYTSWSERVRNSKVVEALESRSYPTLACAEYAAYSTTSPYGSLSLESYSDDEDEKSKQVLPYCLHIQTQLCHKDTLKDWLKNNILTRKRKLVFEIFEQIHDAVVYIHQKGLLHRDLNPSNIFFSQEGSSVKVGDFGLVTTRQQKHSHRGQVGKWLYMPPEQYVGRNYDEKVDIYALGVIYFELNCPFSTPQQRFLVLYELHFQQKLPSTFFQQLPEEAVLTELMLAADPSKRPSAKQISGSDCLKELRKTIERSGTATVPLHHSPDTATPVFPSLEYAQRTSSLRDSGVSGTPSHSYIKSQYLGLHFLQGSPWKECVTTEGKKISWDDIGIQFDIPADAVFEDRLLHLNVWPCMSGRFILPEDCNLASPVFMLSPGNEFRKDVTVSMVHFMDLQSEDERMRMVFIAAPSTPIDRDGKPEYHFAELFKRGVFHIGQGSGSIALNKLCALAIGRKQKPSEAPTVHFRDIDHGSKRKHDEGSVKYSLQLYQTSDKAVFSVSICHPMFERSLMSTLEEQYPGVTPLHSVSVKAPVYFSHDDVSLGIPTESMSGWRIIPDITPCQISKDEVDLPLNNPDYASESFQIYPPRVWLTLVHPQVTPQTQTRNCVLSVCGLTKQYTFNIQLKSTTQVIGAQSMMISPGASTATLTATSASTATLTATSASTATLTATSASTATLTATPAPSATLTSTSASTATLTSTSASTATLTATSASTATLTATSASTATLTSTSPSTGPASLATVLTDERPTIQMFQSLTWKNGQRMEEIRIMDEVKPHWREFGIALGFSIGDLDAIEQEGLGKPDRCIQKVFGEWSRTKSESYHWNGLITALNRARFSDLAKRISHIREQNLPSTLGEMWKHPLVKPYILPTPKLTGRLLGAGTYGSVEEVEIDGTIYAGKKFRCDIFSSEEKFCKMFTREYGYIHRLQHKHIVHYHGISSLPDSNLPLLLMEKLETSVHKYLLNPDNADRDLAVKVSILRGVAKGLIHLHNQTPPIIHRDLTAKNVLLDSSELVAKISDFGNARLFDIDPSSELATMSNVPGTLLYMPPEALNHDARYNTKLDIFSYGHLALFTTTQVFPCSLLSHTYPGPSGRKGQLLGRTEVERRKQYFDIIGDQHPLTCLIKQCLDNEPEERPKATKIETNLDEVLSNLRIASKAVIS